MPELLGRLVADCPRRRQQEKSFSVYDRCRAVYDRASRYSPRKAVYERRVK
jgi:hypothetical protein